MTQEMTQEAGVRRPLATAQQIADYLDVPLNTVYGWSSRGGGPPLIKVGRHLRAHWDEIDRWLKSHTVGTP